MAGGTTLRVWAKERLSVSVDAELIAAGRRAVAEGSRENLSAWVNEALRSRAELDAKLRALSDWVAEYEAEFGEISDEEIAEVTVRMQSRAIRVRPASEVA